MKKIYQKPSFRTADIQPETFLDLSQGQQAEDPINSAKGNSLGCEEKTTNGRIGITTTTHSTHSAAVYKHALKNLKDTGKLCRP